jgi:hypothetical protein
MAGNDELDPTQYDFFRAANNLVPAETKTFIQLFIGDILVCSPLTHQESDLMNWDAMSAVGEVMGAPAVLITLIYLAIQIKQNTAAVATSICERVMSGLDDVDINVASNPALASLLDRACNNPGLLKAEEVIQFNFLLRCYANQWWKLFKLYDGGIKALSP